MKIINQHQRLVILALLIAAKLFTTWMVGEPVSNTAGLAAVQQATSTPVATLAPTPGSAAAAGDVIPLKPLTDLKSLNATVKINTNGMLNGKVAQGDLTAQLTTNDQNMSKISVTGSLLGDVVASVGGSAVSLFRPKQVDIYKVPTGTYAVVNGLFPVCIKPNAPKATEALDDMSPSALMSMLTGSDVARGKLIGDDTINGVPVKHYVINGDAFLAAAQNSSDPNLRTFGESLWSAKDADLFVSTEGGYPVSFQGNYSGAYAPLKFEGDFGVQVDLTGVNANTPIVLPDSCNNPISQ